IERATEKEIRDLASTIVVDQRVPVFMEALTRVCVLIEVGPIELRQTVRVVGKMAGDPIENYTDPAAMKAVDQRPEIVRGPESCGRGEKPGRLIAPRPVERKLG